MHDNGGPEYGKDRVLIPPSAHHQGYRFAGCEFDATTTVNSSGQNVQLVGTPVISGNKTTTEIQTRTVILLGKGETTLTVKTGDTNCDRNTHREWSVFLTTQTMYPGE